MIDQRGENVMSRRKYDLECAKVYGYENDLRSFTRLVIESRVARHHLDAQWALGWRMAEAKRAAVEVST